MKKLLLSALPALLWCVTHAQQPTYNVADIPEAIKKNVSIVKRYENTYFEITDIDRAVLKVQEAYTVLNEDGDHMLVFQNYSSKFIFLADAEIRVYDATGKQINKYKKKDLSVQAFSDGLIDDGKISYLKVPASSYPITVEFLYEEKYKGSLHLPSYDVSSPGIGVQQSSFTARVPKDLDLRYKECNIKLAPKVTEDDKYKTYQWTVINRPAVESEAGTTDAIYPSIKLAATRFKMDEYEGDMSTWKGLGAWIYNMHKGVDELPADRKAFLKDLVKDAKDDREKVKIIYDYLQKNFRYVSIQLGIGGWKSLPASFTDQKKYGDCKGLSQYMHAALQVVGVRSHTALINSGANRAPLDPSFPMSAFNHVILCVPQPRDSIWLECTSNTADFNVLGVGTENRNALLITEDGGVLVSTPVSKPMDNKMEVTSQVNLQADGSGRTVTSFNSTGIYKRTMDYIADEKKDDQKEYIVYGLGFKQPDEFVLAKKASTGSPTTELDMKLEKIPEFMAGNKMFISARLYKLCDYKLPKAENRQYDYYFQNPYQKKDTTILQLPEGFVVEALPKPKELQCKYASYITQYWYDESKKAVVSTTSLALNNQKIPVADYAAVKKFFEEVIQDDAQRIVIKKP